MFDCLLHARRTRLPLRKSRQRCAWRDQKAPARAYVAHKHNTARGAAWGCAGGTRSAGAGTGGERARTTLPPCPLSSTTFPSTCSPAALCAALRAHAQDTASYAVRALCHVGTVALQSLLSNLYTIMVPRTAVPRTELPRKLPSLASIRARMHRTLAGDAPQTRGRRRVAPGAVRQGCAGPGSTTAASSLALGSLQAAWSCTN